jgi:hypothetical protein
MSRHIRRSGDASRSRRAFDPESFKGQDQPPRPPYQSNAQLIMPPLPKCCPRCTGLVMIRDSEGFCLLCGWRPKPLEPIPAPNSQKPGTHLPAVVATR